MRRIASVIFVLLCFWGVSEELAAQATPNAASADPVVLRPGDVLRIDVWPNNDLSGDFTVEESGLVYLPFLGEVQAAGVTLDDLRGRLREGYSQMIQNPVVTVSVVFNVGVLGAVSRPGVYQATTTTTLIDAIGMAGGFAPAADQERVRIVRDGRSIDVDAFRMLSTGQDVSALRLRSGDQVVVEGSRGGVDWRSILSIVQTVVTIAVLVDRVRN